MSFSLRIFAIDREIFFGDAKSVIVPGAKGQMQILAEHAPLVSVLKEGDIVIEQDNGQKQTIPIQSGALEVNTQEVVCLVNF